MAGFQSARTPPQRGENPESCRAACVPWQALKPAFLPLSDSSGHVCLAFCHTSYELGSTCLPPRPGPQLLICELMRGWWSLCCKPHGTP